MAKGKMRRALSYTGKAMSYNTDRYSNGGEKLEVSNGQHTVTYMRHVPEGNKSKLIFKTPKTSPAHVYTQGTANADVEADQIEICFNDYDMIDVLQGLIAIAGDEKHGTK